MAKLRLLRMAAFSLVCLISPMIFLACESEDVIEKPPSAIDEPSAEAEHGTRAEESAVVIPEGHVATTETPSTEAEPGTTAEEPAVVIPEVTIVPTKIPSVLITPYIDRFTSSVAINIAKEKIEMISQVKDYLESPLVLNEPGKEAQIVISNDAENEALNSTYYENHLYHYRKIRFVAELIQRYFQRVSGTELEIVTDAEADLTRPQIVLGRSRLNDYLNSERDALPPEGFLVRRIGNKISIIGQLQPAISIDPRNNPEFNNVSTVDTGVLFGAAEFIEKVLGVKWYFAGDLGTVVPNKNEIVVENLNVTDAPYYKQRDAWYNIAKFLNPDEYGSFGDVLAAGFRLGNSSGFSLNHVDEFFNSTDLQRIYDFQEAGGKEILARNQAGEIIVHGSVGFHHLKYVLPETAEFEMRRLRNYLESGDNSYHYPASQPNRIYAKFMPADLENIYSDSSPETVAEAIHVENYLSPYRHSELSNIIFKCVERFAKLVKENYPSMRVAFAAYAGYFLPPTVDSGITIPDNADIMIVTPKGNSALVSTVNWDLTKNLIEKWWTLLGHDRKRIYLWEYGGIYPVMPLILFPHKMKEWYQFNKDKINGIFLEGDLTSRGTYKRNILNHYIRAKLWWNPDANVDTLISQFSADLFGNAAADMNQLFQFTANQYEQQAKNLWTGIGPGVVATPGELTETVTLTKVCRTAYPQTFINTVNHLFESALSKVEAGSIEKKRIEFFKEGYKELEDLCAPYQVQ